ncbi:DUF4328 domain-containing protein [Leptospira sp. 201903070]|uniref:DUF4328 domain-containing protein n=1 Tax=Leptospira ainlahdjerensis TaxID=2810033 RepID=A0ABS2UCJ7_9LEPT|nr:DUF4328 domain-containing protein [Leptospira ainlahdjerensis]MBM9578099.1 DUF4328 domain-containing protein [Leptospira ainlahdjerensis]
MINIFRNFLFFLFELLLIAGIVGRIRRLFINFNYDISYAEASLELGSEQLLFELAAVTCLFFSTIVFSIWIYIVHKCLRKNLDFQGFLSDWWGIFGFYIPIASYYVPFFYIYETYENLYRIRFGKSIPAGSIFRFLLILFWIGFVSSGLLILLDYSLIEKTTVADTDKIDIAVSVTLILQYVSLFLIGILVERRRRQVA